MTTPEDTFALSTSLSLKELGECVDVARSLNELSFQTPGMLWRAEWENALESLVVLDPDGVLDKVLATFSARLAYLGSWNVMSDPMPEEGSEMTEYRRFTADDLDGLKDLLVRADRASVEGLSSSDVHKQRMACDLLERAVPLLVLATHLLKYETHTLRSWLQAGRGLHGVSAAMSNRDFVQRIFEALDDITFAHRGWPPKWRRLMFVNRTWRDAVQALGRYVALPPNAKRDVVDAALRQLPSIRMLICTLTHLSVTGARGLTDFVDLLRGAHALVTLRVAGWIQCETTPEVAQLDVVTLPRVRSFELVGSRADRRLRTISGANVEPTVSLIRYVRLPAVEYAAISEPVESAEGLPAQERLRALASHLAAVAAALTATAPCLRGTEQFTIATDPRSTGLVLRTRRSMTYVEGERLVPPLTIHIHMIPPAQSDTRPATNPVAVHLFIRLCQALAPSVQLDGTPQVLPVNSLAAIDVAAVPMLSESEGPRRLSYNPPWTQGSRGDYDMLQHLPIHDWGIHTLTQPARIVLFLSDARSERPLLPLLALDIHKLERAIPLMPSHVLSSEPAIQRIELNAQLSDHFIHRNMLSSPDLQDILRVRAVRGLRIHSITFARVHPHGWLDIQPLKEAAQAWGDGVRVQRQNTAEGTYSGKALVFEPLQ